MEMEKRMFGKQMFARSCRDSGMLKEVLTSRPARFLPIVHTIDIETSSHCSYLWG